MINAHLNSAHNYIVMINVH